MKFKPPLPSIGQLKIPPPFFGFSFSHVRIITTTWMNRTQEAAAAAAYISRCIIYRPKTIRPCTHTRVGEGEEEKRKTLGLSYCLLSLSPAIQKLLCRVVVHTVLQKSSLRVFHVKWCAIPPRISLESKRLRYQKVGIKGSMTTTSSAMQHLPRSSSNSFSLTALSISSHTELVCVMFSAESFIFFFRSDGTQSGELLLFYAAGCALPHCD